MKWKIKRPILILEVLLSFTLVLIAFFPLVTPHVAMMREYRTFTSKLELNHLVNLVYVDLLEQMYLGKISFRSLESQDELFVEDQSLLEELQKLPYQTKFCVTDLKPNKPKGEVLPKLYLMTLTLQFIPKTKGSSIEHNYKLLVGHYVQGESNL